MASILGLLKFSLALLIKGRNLVTFLLHGSVEASHKRRFATTVLITSSFSCYNYKPNLSCQCNTQVLHNPSICNNNHYAIHGQ
jgi:hypothetical protein